MSYVKQNFEKGQILKADHLNHMEDGIAQLASEVETPKDGTQIDDTTVGLDAWSSKHIVDMLCPPLEETGNPVQCYPVAGYPLGCKVSWEPTQEGSGEPSPENIRPIKGRDSVTVNRADGLRAWKLITLDGTEKWSAKGSGDKRYFSSPLISIGARMLSSNDYCTTFPIAQVLSSNTVQGVSGWNTFLYLRWSTFADVDALKSYLAAQYAAGTPVQVCYKLVEPVSFTATGAQPIPALSGVNTVLTDADSATVTGRADPIKRITDLEDAVASMT